MHLSMTSICSHCYVPVLHVYPSIFTLAAVGQGTFALGNMFRTWSQTVRDKEFLVDMRLQNFEPEQENKVEEKVETIGEIPIGLDEEI